VRRNPQFVYDGIYGLRGTVENGIKELKLELKAHRLSCHRFLANQFRLLLHTAASCRFRLLRQHLQGTEVAPAQVNPLRLKLLKIGARIFSTASGEISGRNEPHFKVRPAINGGKLRSFKC
jgi:Transposase DDE domain group 1